MISRKGLVHSNSDPNCLQLIKDTLPNVTFHMVPCLSHVSSTLIRISILPFSVRHTLYCNYLGLVNLFAPCMKLSTSDINTSVLKFIEEKQLYLFSRTNKAKYLQRNVLFFSALSFAFPSIIQLLHAYCVWFALGLITLTNELFLVFRI